MIVQLPVSRTAHAPLTAASTAEPFEFIVKAGSPAMPERTSWGVVQVPPAGRSALHASAPVDHTAVAAPVFVSCTMGSDATKPLDGGTRSALFHGPRRA